MSLSSEEHTNPSCMDISDAMIFSAHNSAVSDPTGKRKRLPSTSHQTSLSPSSISPPYVKIMVNPQHLATKTHVFHVHASAATRQRGKVVKVWKQVGGTQQSCLVHEVRHGTSSSAEGQPLKSHKHIVDKLVDVLDVHKVNVQNDNVQSDDPGGKKPPDHTFHT